MFTLVLVLHVIVCLFLIFIVLIQSGKGAELGAAFGGSSQTIFGARGAATFFSKLTTVSAIVFMLTSFSLAILTTRGGSVVKRAPAATEQKKAVPTGPQSPLAPTQGQQSAPAGPVPSAPAAPSK